MDNVFKGLIVLEAFMDLNEEQKTAVFAKLTGKLFAMNNYRSHGETTDELIDELCKYLLEEDK